VEEKEAEEEKGVGSRWRRRGARPGRTLP